MIEAYIANMSMNMAQASVQSQASTKMLKNTMDNTEQQASQLIDAMQSMPAPAANAVGGLMDVRG